VTPAQSCPNFPEFVLPDQCLPGKGLRVTYPRKHLPTGGDPGTPVADDAPPHESPGDLSRDEDAPTADTTQDDTLVNSSSGSLQLIDGDETTSGRIDTVSVKPSSLSSSTGV